MSNQDTAKILDALAQISSRLSKLEIAVGGKSSGGSGPDAEETAPQVEAFDTFNAEKVNAFAAACTALGIPEMAKQATDGFNNMRTLIDMGSKCYKPEQGDLMKYASGMVDQVKGSGAEKNNSRGTDFQNHWFAWADACSGSFSWTVMGSMPVAKTIQDSAIDGAMFYINKVRKGNSDDKTKKWFQSLLQMLNGLRDYAKEYHKTGLTWGVKALGAKACSEYKATGGESKTSGPPKGGPPPPGPPPPLPAGRGPPPPLPPAAANTNSGDGGNKDALFAQIRAVQERQKGGKTAGLRHVKKDASGKKFAEDDAAKKKKAAAAAKRRFGTKTIAKKAAVVKTPVKVLQMKKWRIEHQTSMVELKEEELNVKQTVYIYGCTGATIVINGKVNMITLDNCKKTNVVFDSTLGGIETVNCKSCKIQVRKSCNTIAIDKTDGIQVYLSKECMDNVVITAAKSSEMNVAFPKSQDASDDDDLIERPIPEQYVHKVVNGELTAEVSDLYGH
jgi:adenylyl cyclase-associated protein